MLTEEEKRKKKDRLKDYLNPSAMAYRDLCRTIRTREDKGKPNNDTTLSDIREKVITEINSALIKLSTIPKQNGQDEFNTWHENACKMIINTYNQSGDYQKTYKEFKYGQAQKWVNMTLKNKYILSDDDDVINEIYKYLHCPVDSYIITAAKDINKVLGEEHKFNFPISGWSQWNENEYTDFQDWLRKNLVDLPIDFEFEVWQLYTAAPSKAIDRKAYLKEQNYFVDGHIKPEYKLAPVQDHHL